MLSININSKKFQNNIVMKNLSLKLDKNKFTSIIGPSGCGKSTLLQIIAGLDEDFLGQISLDDKKISELNLGFMFQDSRLIPWLSVYENLMLISSSKKEEEILNALEKVGLKEYVHSHVKELSGGMQRRVSLVRTFLNKPELILLDEAFISLDYPTAQNLRADFLKLFNEYKPTVVFVTHNLKEAISMSNRIVFLDKNPMNIIYDFKNENDFSSNLEDIRIDEIKNDLLNTYPNILSGDSSS